MEQLVCRLCGQVCSQNYDGLTCPRCGGMLKTRPVEERVGGPLNARVIQYLQPKGRRAYG